MKTTLHTDWTVSDICKGFIFDKNENKGLFGLDGQHHTSYNMLQEYFTIRAAKNQ